MAKFGVKHELTVKFPQHIRHIFGHMARFNFLLVNGNMTCFQVLFVFADYTPYVQRAEFCIRFNCLGQIVCISIKKGLAEFSMLLGNWFL